MTNGFPSVLLWHPLRYWNTLGGQRINGRNKGRKRNDRVARFHVVRVPGPRWVAQPLLSMRGRGPGAKSHSHVAETCRRWMKRCNCRRSAQGSEGGRSAITCVNVSLSIVEYTNTRSITAAICLLSRINSSADVALDERGSFWRVQGKCSAS